MPASACSALGWGNPSGTQDIFILQIFLKLYHGTLCGLGMSGGRAHAECTLTPPRIPTKDRCTLSRSSLHWVAGDLGTSTASAPPMGLLTSRMACVKRMQSCEQRPGTVKAQCGHWGEEREQHDLLPHFWVLHTHSLMPVPGIENSGLGTERPKVLNLVPSLLSCCGPAPTWTSPGCDQYLSLAFPPGSEVS